MGWDRVAGNQAVKRVLRRAIEFDAIHPAYIFAGPQGVGKYRFALEFAKALACKQSPANACDQCSTCLRIDAGHLPDVITITPDGKNIKVEQVRSIIPQVYSTPVECPRRVFILDDADALNDVSSSALLKTLEEPPPTSVLILIVKNPYRLLPTIRSRSQILSFSPLSAEQTRALLATKMKARSDDLETLALLSCGRPGVALSLDLKRYRSQRVLAMNLLNALSGGGSSVEILIAAGEMGNGERDEVEERLSVLNGLLRDLLHLSEGSATELSNEDCRETLEVIASRITLRQLIDWYDAASQLQRNLRVNINTRVSAEGNFVAWSH